MLLLPLCSVQYLNIRLGGGHVPGLLDPVAAGGDVHHVALVPTTLRLLGKFLGKNLCSVSKDEGTREHYYN